MRDGWTDARQPGGERAGRSTDRFEVAADARPQQAFAPTDTPEHRPV